MTPPTPHGIRSDAMGDGHFGSRRGSRTHRGTDYNTHLDDPVVSPINGLVVRKASASGGPYSGLLIRNSEMEVKMFYFEPDFYLIGSYVAEGDVIGRAQDISKKYGPKMKPHIHLQVKRMEYVDPELLMEG